MTTLTVPEAQAHLPMIIEDLNSGEEIVLTQNQQPVARLPPMHEDTARPVFGNCRGNLVIVAEDEEHLNDFSATTP